MGQGLLQSGRVHRRVWLARVGERLGLLQSRGVGKRRGLLGFIVIRETGLTTE